MSPLAAFAEEVARALGGKAVVLDTGTWPSSAVRIGDHCVLLLREHKGHGGRAGTFLLSLPLRGAWKVSADAPEAWRAFLPDIASALASEPSVVSMSDVIARLSGEWEVSFDALAIPSEAFLHRGARWVRLEQQPGSVTIAISAGSTLHPRELATLGSIDGLSAWVEEKIALQAGEADAATARLEADTKRRAAVPPPPVEQVIAALREGLSIQVGGGRSLSTYLMKDGQLVVIQSDDGHTEEHPCSEAWLREVIAQNPYLFREVLEHWKARR